MENTKPNFLPEEEKKDTKELQGKSGGIKPEVKLVVPEKDDNAAKKEGKKDSWWQRRKRKKAMKEAEKLRRKGETGLVKEAKQEAKSIEGSGQSKSSMFGEVKKETKPAETMPKKMEQTKPMPAPAPTPIEETKPMPKMKEMPAKEEMPKKELVEPKNKEEKKAKMHQAAQFTGFGGPKVNLVSNEMAAESESPNWLVAVIILVFTIAVWVIIGGVAVSRVKSAEAQIQADTEALQKLSIAIAALQEDKTLAQKIQKQFDSVSSLVENHLYWSPVLEKLEELTIPDAYYSRMNSDLLSNTLTVEVVAKNYNAAARQIRSFELAPNFVSDIFVGEARIENQPGAELPVPIVKVELQLTLAEGILSFDLPE